MPLPGDCDGRGRRAGPCPRSGAIGDRGPGIATCRRPDVGDADREGPSSRHRGLDGHRGASVEQRAGSTQSADSACGNCRTGRRHARGIAEPAGRTGAADRTAAWWFRNGAIPLAPGRTGHWRNNPFDPAWRTQAVALLPTARWRTAPVLAGVSSGALPLRVPVIEPRREEPDPSSAPLPVDSNAPPPSNDRATSNAFLRNLSAYAPIYAVYGPGTNSAGRL